MAIRPRIRKRVQAVRRAADGSAFEKCEECGVMIAIALFDMHECGERRKEVKRFKYIASDRVNKTLNKTGSFENEPRSPFVFFLEDFRGSYKGSLVDASRICFNVWKKMSPEEQKPFNARATEVDLAHSLKLNEEARTTNKRIDEDKRPNFLPSSPKLGYVWGRTSLQSTTSTCYRDTPKRSHRRDYNKEKQRGKP